MTEHHGNDALHSGFFRSLLLNRKEEIQYVSTTGEEAAGVVELDQTRVGRLSRMDALQAQAMSQEVGRRRKLELARIIQALERIESGNYGYCILCDGEIGIERLKLDPSNPFCINCAK